MSDSAFVMAGKRIALLVLQSVVAACGAMQQPAVQTVAAAIECAVAADPARPQAIIGYGSLMQDESRNRTSPRAGPAHPVEVTGYRRAWIERVQTGSFGITFLGVRPDRESSMNAVVYAVEQDELAATDKREASYCRVNVPLEDVRPLEAQSPLAPQAQVWIYVSKPERVSKPDARFPIVQSYVDIFVSGCLEQEQRFGLQGFSRQCLATTGGWSGHWVNDRIYPRRPFVFQPKAGQIDKLLSTQLPEYFSRIRIEGGS